MTDSELVERAKQDIDYFSELFDRYFTRVYQFHYFRIRQKEDAEDLTSETFMKIFKKLDTYHEKGIPFSVWVFTVARNTLIDFVRKNKMKTQPIEESAPEKALMKDFDIAAIERSVLSEKLWEAIKVLPEKQQQIWALKLASDLPHKEIATILGTTENNVNVAVSRSMKTLKRYLQPLVE